MVLDYRWQNVKKEAEEDIPAAEYINSTVTMPFLFSIGKAVKKKDAGSK